MAEAREANIVIDSVGVIGFDDFIEEVKNEARQVIEQSFKPKEGHEARVDRTIKEIESEIHQAAEQAFQPKEVTRIIVTGKLNI